MHGRVLALQTVLLGAGAAFGGPFLGWLADTAGARVVVALGGLVCLGAAGGGAIACRSEAKTTTGQGTPDIATPR